MKVHDEQSAQAPPEGGVDIQGRRTYLTIPELADYLRISPSTIRNHMKDASLPRKKVFGRVLFDLEEVNRWVAEQSELDGMIRRVSAFDSNPRIGRRDPTQPKVFTLD